VGISYTGSMRTGLTGGDGVGGGVPYAARDFSIAGIPGILPGVEVQQLIPKQKGQRFPKAYIRGWPTPIPLKGRTEIPPVFGHPVYGPSAKNETLKLLRDAKRARVHFGWRTKVSLLKVIHGERPLAFDVWSRAVLHLENSISEREQKKRRAAPPQLNVKLIAGSRPGLGWSSRSA